jgi:hypothetical protein
VVREFRTLQKRKMAAGALPGIMEARQLLGSERQFEFSNFERQHTRKYCASF